MLTKITCPKCNVEGTFSLSDPVFDGPYKCWKCKELFHVRIERNVLKVCEPMSGEELARFEQIQSLRNKFSKSD